MRMMQEPVVGDVAARLHAACVAAAPPGPAAAAAA
jgi:hypothetical protein